MNEPSHIAFRVTTLLFAILLCLQCLWLLLAELGRPGIDGLPADATAAAAAAGKRNGAAWAASIGVLRGDLWAEAAFTYANLLFGPKVADGSADQLGALARADADIDHALSDAPYRSDAWLLLAALTLRYPLAGLDPAEALKMSYFTGPSEQDLVLPRLRLAASSDTFANIDMRPFIGRDVRLLLGRKLAVALTEVYSGAPPAGKRLIEQAVAEVDPSAIDSLAAGAQSQNQPAPPN